MIFMLSTLNLCYSYVLLGLGRCYSFVHSGVGISLYWMDEKSCSWNKGPGNT